MPDPIEADVASRTSKLPEADLPATGEALAHAPPVDLAPIVQAVGRELRGQVPPQRIEHRLKLLLAHEFGQARVTTFLPIFLCRHACESFRAEAAREQGRIWP